LNVWRQFDAKQTDTAQSDIDAMLIGENLPLGDILEHLLPLEM
jgi:hypothetical protein